MKYDVNQHPLFAVMALLLAACSSGGGGGYSGGNNNDDDNNDGPRFTGASVEAGDSIKHLAFSWSFDGQADAFRLEVNPDGASGYSAVDVDGDGTADAGDELDGGASALDLDIPLHLTDFANARYQVVALDAGGGELDRSAELSIMDLTARALTGYIKASNTDAGDAFGFRVALSDDGATLAVGAVGEAGAGTGVSTDGTGEADNSAGSAGAVYVFGRDGDGWSQQAYIKASNTDASDNFGASVALSGAGDTLAVGATAEASAATGVSTDGTGEADNSADGAGAVYVFTRDGGAWSQQAYVKASNAEADDRFGIAVDLSDDGDALAVSAWGESSAATGVSTDGTGEADNSAVNAGAVYLFARAGGAWSQQAYVKASNSDPQDFFGNALALSGDGATLAVAAVDEASNATGVSTDGSGEANNDISNAGAVYVFTDDGDNWSQQAYVKASNTDSDDFGESVALSADGNVLAVGAVREESAATGVSTDGSGEADNSVGNAGAAYVFLRDGGAWSQQAYVKASNTGENDRFGYSIALSDDGNTLTVGSRAEASDATGVSTDGTGEADNSADGTGAVYLFARGGGTWSQVSYVKPVESDAYDEFAEDIALAGLGRTLAVGATSEAGSATGVSMGAGQADDDAEFAGAAYLY